MLLTEVERLLERVLALLAERQRLPEATYRLQFHAGFTFRDATRIVPYLHALGVSHCYGSPYLQARPGSTHGYDITDHRQLNPEVGTDADFEAWVTALHEHGMGQILDMVPNHMGVVGNANPWWNDVLENGPSSPYAAHFDIAWYASPRPELRGRVLLPVLGEPYGQVLEAGQLQLKLEAGSLAVYYYEHRFPLEPSTYAVVLGHRLEGLAATLPPDDPGLNEYQSILSAVRHLPHPSETAPAQVAERQREKEVIKRRLAALLHERAPIRESLERTLQTFNGQAGNPQSFDLLDRLLDEQPYRLSSWRVASDEINYRRFFDVNELAALNMEREEVFTATHERMLRLLGEGKLNGLRIDHPDGLFDPKQYLQRLQLHYVLACARHCFETEPQGPDADWPAVESALREHLAQSTDGRLVRPLYVVVEKILAADEPLPDDWPTHGTSGYDFLNKINGLFVATNHASAFTRLYQEWTNDDTPFAEVVYQKKFLIMQVALASELYMLAHQLDRLAQKNRRSRDFTLNSLRHTLREVIAWFPVYRAYTAGGEVRATDRRCVETAVRKATIRNPTVNRSLFRFVRDMLLLRYPDGTSDADQDEQRRFAGKFQQVSAPVMAKGVEDTSFYVFNRLVSLNEVGGDPGRFGLQADAVHRALQDRQAKAPYAFSALSTHDTKRSEDVRARLNILSEMPDEWRAALQRWGKLNEGHRQQLEDQTVPDLNEEYLLYQTLLGAWPLGPTTPEEFAKFVERIQAYLMKALHEAKVHTSWINPQADYDEAFQRFVALVLDEAKNTAFLEDFRTFQARISHYGLLNALAQTLLRITAPGVPDTYQGTELWDFSLVDPDNRRPVDYELRQRLLTGLQERTRAAGNDRSALVQELCTNRNDGRIKLYLTWQALTCRRDHPGLFTTGEYLPAETTGARKDHLFGFARRQGDRWAVVAVPRFVSQLTDPSALPLGSAVWQDTQLLLPAPAESRFRNVLTGTEAVVQVTEGHMSFAAGDLFSQFPVALLVSD